MGDDRNRLGIDSDRRLVAHLRRSAAWRDPVRPRVVEAAHDAIRWRITDAEIAELEHTSLDGDVPVGLRAGAPPVLLSFEAPHLDVEVEVVRTGDRRRVLGQLAPARPGRVRVRHPGGSTNVRADEVGRFAADGVEPGPVSLRCEPVEGADGPVVETDWFLA